MNATALPANQFIIADMTQSLLIGARRDVVDLGDFRAVRGHLIRAGFLVGDIHELAEHAVEKVRAAMQTARAPLYALLEAGAFTLVIAAWVVGYVAVCPA
jgi:hypothetical protein